MKSNTRRKVIGSAAAVALWIVVWQAAAMYVGERYLLPSPLDVAVRFTQLLGEGEFWKTALVSLLRINGGWLAGMAAGIIIGAVCCAGPFLHALFSPLITVVRATPIASFIVLVLVWLSDKNQVTVFIVALMVIPIVWGGVTAGYDATDLRLLEMSQVYRFGRIKKLRHIYIPSVIPYFRSSAITSLGLAWKAGVAAEVLCRPEISIGTKLYESKLYIETVDLFAWTLTVILLSLVFELLLRRIVRPVKGGAA